jgi:hypothetical protein
MKFFEGQTVGNEGIDKPEQGARPAPPNQAQKKHDNDVDKLCKDPCFWARVFQN